MLGIISEKALMLNRKVEYLAIKSMRAKISTFLLEQYKKTGKTTFMIPLNRNELADFLNVSRPSMSREMCRMKEEGIIDFHRASIRIINPDALKKSVE
jgi:CRP-like cAMP-binding protein